MDNENTQEATWTITIKSLSKRKEVSVPAGCTVEKLREEASKLFEIETAQTNLIFGGKILKDNENLKDHGIGSNSTVHLVIRHKKVDDSKPPTTQVSQQPNIDQHTEGAATLPGLPPAPFSSLPFGNANFNEIQQNLFRTLQTDPNAIQNLLSNPMVQGLMSNPELLRSIMLNNPQMQRVIEQNPEVSQFFNNPDFMRQTMEMIRNPTTLQEIMRNHDRALINLESLPGGYNALQRIYRDFQEPMLNATQEQFGYNPLNTNSSSSTTANTSQVGTENTDPLPNPWASQNTVFQNNRSASGLNQLPFNLVDSSRSNVSNTNPLDLPLQSTSSENTARYSTMNPQQLRQLLVDAAENPGMLIDMLRASSFNPNIDNFIRDPSILLNLLRTYGFVQDERQREQVHRVVHEFISQWSIPEIRALYTNPRALMSIIQIQQNLIRLRDTSPQVYSRLISSNISGLVYNQMNSQTSSPNVDSVQSHSNRQTASATTASQNIQNSNQDYTASLFQLLNLLHPQQHQPTNQQPSQTPEQLYASELEQMQTMGFHNRDANLRALVASMGDVNMAVERILEQQQNFRQNPPNSQP